MKPAYFLFVTAIVAVTGTTSCKKNNARQEELQKKATDFQASVNTRPYQLVSFYADKPIDYVTTDNEVKAETDLNIYIKSYLLDDENFFNANGQLQVVQNENKMPAVPQDTLDRTYKIWVENDKVNFTYLDYYYQPLTFNVEEFNDQYFIISVPGPQGSHLFSKFVRL